MSDPLSDQPETPLPRPEMGALRSVDGALEVWTEKGWMSARQAMEEDLVELDDVGQKVKSIHVGGGAFGGPGEYTLWIYIWKVGNQYYVDRREEVEDSFWCASMKEATREVKDIMKYL